MHYDANKCLAKQVAPESCGGKHPCASIVQPDPVDHPVFCSQVVSVAAVVYVVYCTLLLHAQLLAVVRFADLQVFIFQHCQNLCIVDPVGWMLNEFAGCANVGERCKPKVYPNAKDASMHFSSCGARHWICSGRHMQGGLRIIVAWLRWAPVKSTPCMCKTQNLCMACPTAQIKNEQCQFIEFGNLQVILGCCINSWGEGLGRTNAFSTQAKSAHTRSRNVRKLRDRLNFACHLSSRQHSITCRSRFLYATLDLTTCTCVLRSACAN